MVEIADAIRYHDSAKALAEWAGLAQAANPETRVYLYETWHHTDDPKGWLDRIDTDYESAWKAQVLYPALAEGHRIYVIPAGQAMAAVARMVEARGGLPGLPDRHALFAKTSEGRCFIIAIRLKHAPVCKRRMGHIWTFSPPSRG
jgi:hypothetical protein